MNEEDTPQWITDWLAEHKGTTTTVRPHSTVVGPSAAPWGAPVGVPSSPSSPYIYTTGTSSTAISNEEAVKRALDKLEAQIKALTDSMIAMGAVASKADPETAKARIALLEELVELRKDVIESLRAEIKEWDRENTELTKENTRLLRENEALKNPSGKPKKSVGGTMTTSFPTSSVIYYGTGSTAHTAVPSGAASTITYSVDPKDADAWKKITGLLSGSSVSLSEEEEETSDTEDEA